MGKKIISVALVLALIVPTITMPNIAQADGEYGWNQDPMNVGPGDIHPDAFAGKQISPEAVCNAIDKSMAKVFTNYSPFQNQQTNQNDQQLSTAWKNKCGQRGIPMDAFSAPPNTQVFNNGANACTYTTDPSGACPIRQESCVNSTWLQANPSVTPDQWGTTAGSGFAQQTCKAAQQDILTCKYAKLGASTQARMYCEARKQASKGKKRLENLAILDAAAAATCGLDYYKMTALIKTRDAATGPARPAAEAALQAYRKQSLCGHAAVGAGAYELFSIMQITLKSWAGRQNKISGGYEVGGSGGLQKTETNGMGQLLGRTVAGVAAGSAMINGFKLAQAYYERCGTGGAGSTPIGTTPAAPPPGGVTGPLPGGGAPVQNLPAGGSNTIWSPQGMNSVPPANGNTILGSGSNGTVNINDIQAGTYYYGGDTAPGITAAPINPRWEPPAKLWMSIPPTQAGRVAFFWGFLLESMTTDATAAGMLGNITGDLAQTIDRNKLCTDANTQAQAALKAAVTFGALGYIRYKSISKAKKTVEEADKALYGLFGQQPPLSNSANGGNGGGMLGGIFGGGNNGGNGGFSSPGQGGGGGGSGSGANGWGNGADQAQMFGAIDGSTMDGRLLSGPLGRAVVNKALTSGLNEKKLNDMLNSGGGASGLLSAAGASMGMGNKMGEIAAFAEQAFKHSENMPSLGTYQLASSAGKTGGAAPEENPFGLGVGDQPIATPPAFDFASRGPAQEEDVFHSGTTMNIFEIVSRRIGANYNKVGAGKRN